MELLLGEPVYVDRLLVPFHLPHMIYRGKIKYKGEERDFSIKPAWWTTMGIENSIEQFYQQNKVLEVKQ